MRSPTPAALALLLLVSAPLRSSELVMAFDPAKSSIHWTLVGNVHTVHGTFRLKQGRIAWDPATGAISGQVVADATSGESGNGARDRRMDKDVLETEDFKEIQLTPKKLEGEISLTGHSTVRVTGTFQIHGSTHQVTIPMDVSFFGNTVTGTGKFSIPYVDWGMKDPSNFLFRVDKSVEVAIVAVGNIEGK